jgi:hypothetical protein
VLFQVAWVIHVEAPRAVVDDPPENAEALSLGLVQPHRIGSVGEVEVQTRWHHEDVRARAVAVGDDRDAWSGLELAESLGAGEVAVDDEQPVEPVAQGRVGALNRLIEASSLRAPGFGPVGHGELGDLVAFAEYDDVTWPAAAQHAEGEVLGELGDVDRASLT